MPIVKETGKRPKNLIPKEPIEFVTFPVWEKQPYEMLEWYERFSLWYLSLPSGYRTLNRAYQNCSIAAGQEIPKTQIKRNIDTPDNWEIACKNYRWEERARAYWLKKVQEQDGHIDHVLTEIRERTLKIAMKSLDKIEAMTNYPISRKQITSINEDGTPLQVTIEPNGNWSHRDALTMSKALTDVLEKVMGLDTLEYALNIVQKHGLAVIDPDGKIIGQGAIGSNADDLAVIIRDSAEIDDVLIPTKMMKHDEDEE